MTARDETNCTGVLAKGGHGVGEPGNLCHVDCSNRGFCDGDACICYPGFAGDDCSERSGARTKGGAPVAALQPAAVPVPEPNATVEATNATVDADAANASAIPASVQMLVTVVVGVVIVFSAPWIVDTITG